ncbi:hypothetical protein DYB37_005784 [Aphanomyces astaci]|uniref:FYVE-type domain-containing protein n=1 Tax=Aphanomyces astaci TaxID=112090 RepID=A0A3R6YVM8_APHAT|nr:hypothetical protein DYB35_009850 [Aphanomyces astaci]RHZ25649.1 hypothetical protein DYB37_005784 [Aphanomyces astaci]
MYVTTCELEAQLIDNNLILQFIQYLPMTIAPTTPDKKFKCPPLHPVKERALVQRGLTALEDAVAISQLDGGRVVWTVHSRVKGVTIYAGHGVGHFHSMFMATTQVHSTLSEVADLFRAHESLTSMDTDDVVDSAALYHLALPTPDHPRNYVGVQWQALAPAVPMVRKRDVCAVEFQDDFEINGVHGWARAATSVDVEACPNLEPSQGLVRMHMAQFAHIFQESATQSGYLHASLLFQADFGGRLPEWVCDRLILKRVRTLGSLDGQLHRHRLGRTHFLLPHQLDPLSQSHICSTCCRRFGRLSKKFHCLKCGHVVCHRCQQPWRLGRDRRCQVHVCHGCSLEPTNPSFHNGGRLGSITTNPAFLMRNSSGTTSSVQDSSVADRSTSESGHSLGIQLLQSPLDQLLTRLHGMDNIDRRCTAVLGSPKPWDENYVPVVLYEAC